MSVYKAFLALLTWILLSLILWCFEYLRYLPFLAIIITIIDRKSPIAWFIIWTIIWYLRIEFEFVAKPLNHITNHISLEEVSIEGEICENVEINNNLAKYIVCTNSICNASCSSVTWKILVYWSRYPSYHYWDTIRVNWVLSEPFSTEDFSYKNYLRIFGIYGTVRYWKIELLHHEKTPDFFSYLYSLKKYFRNKVSSIYHEPQWSLLNWLLIGEKSGLPNYIIDDFRKNGLAHIVAISWYNITLIIVLISYMFAFLPPKYSFIISSTLIIIFTFFVWASSSVVRASIMWILWLIALRSWRDSDTWLTILITACAMGLYNPLVLWWDLGFHLSFLALIWIVYLKPKIKVSSLIMKPVIEILLLTLSASLMTFPLLSYHFWFISLISPLANLIVTPFIPLAMLSGFLSLIIGSNYLEQLFWFIAYWFLDSILIMSSYFAKFNFTYYELKLGLFWMIGSYALILTLPKMHWLIQLIYYYSKLWKKLLSL